MKYLKVYPEKCVGCRACEEACSTAFFKVNDAEKSAIRIAEKDGGYDIIVCNQCGLCMPFCPADAVKPNDAGTILIKKKICAGCLVCVAECPTGAMRYHAFEPYPFKCTACGICVQKCPAGALEVVKED